ncbi:MAG: DNA repair protein RadA [Hyphomicrobiales bacterium]
MARPAHKYVCQSCGAESAKWSGRCDGCGAWNTIAEEAGTTAGIGAAPRAAVPKGRLVELVGLKGDDPVPARIVSGIAEFDRVTGGGLVPGSAVIVGGDPGIGKSTLLLQALAALGGRGKKVVYFSGEEAIAQVRLRAQRLGLEDAALTLGVETNLSDILTTLDAGPRPDVIVIDSIQTVWSPMLEAAPGTVSQLRAGAQLLINFAKSKGAAVILVGHVTKEGQLAGPKVIEHMVDTVLYFEGEAGHQFRILRSIKNRFGPTDEIGVFEMSDKGLSEVANPSRLFIGDREIATPGAAVFAGMEGTRPLLVEIQALVAASSLGTPRRAVVGWDANRLAMVLAVLDAHCGLHLASYDIYLNVAGGMKVREPAADLAVAAALVSSLLNLSLPLDAVFVGEVSLSGALRPVGHTEARLKEAQKLGFTMAAVPPEAAKRKSKGTRDLRIATLQSVDDLIAWIRENGAAQALTSAAPE